MSCFVVSRKTMNRVVGSLRNPAKGATPPECLKVGSGEDAIRVGRALYKVNVRAVAGRYEEKPEYEAMFQYAPEDVPVTAVEAFKVCQCLAYQCAEEKTERDPLRLALEEWCSELARAIVLAMPEYDAAPWDD